MKHVCAVCVYFLLNLMFFKILANVKYRYYPRFHLAPPHGWMNDPNGFCSFRNKYHLFYQHNPKSSLEPGIVHWGHAVSKDLLHWKHLPIAMYPDKWYDRTGVFSGSALIENDTMYLVYTGNVNHPDKIPDHEQHECLAFSEDGINVTKFTNNSIIYAKEHQPNIRDPKIWKHRDTYYMVLGNSFNNNTLGRVLLYASKNLKIWEEISILGESDGTLGYMWECPDFFEINGSFILIFSPQGVKAVGDKYKNLFQTGYIVGKFDYKTGKFIVLFAFREIDHGHDFYAVQTLLDKKGRRIMVAWLNMWKNGYLESGDGWCGLITLPREISLSANGQLLQKPIREIKFAREELLYSGKGNKDTVVLLKNKAGEVNIIAPIKRNFELIIESCNFSTIVNISFNHKKGLVSLDRGGADGLRRTEWHPSEKLKWTIFIDASCIELFCGDGEVTFSSRFYPQCAIKIRLGENSVADKLRVYAIKTTTSKP